jgi:hypothetical protein
LLEFREGGGGRGPVRVVGESTNSVELWKIESVWIGREVEESSF